MKKYAIGLITGALLGISAMMFMGSQNKNLGDITADSIVAESIVLVGELGVTKMMGGILFQYNTDNKGIAFIGRSDNNAGVIQTFDSEGKRTAFLGTAVGGGGGHLETYNKYGEQTGYFGTNKNNDGVAALCDRYGDEGWGASGKK